MDIENLEYIDQALLTGETQTQSPPTCTTQNERRLDSRSALRSQAAIAMPPLMTRVGELREISRGGLYLAFKDAVTTLFEMENAEIDVGAYADIAFNAPLDGVPHRVNLRSRIARVDHRGIGVQFVTHNPPQLVVLRGYLPPDEHKTVAPTVLQHANPPGRRRQAIKKAPAGSGWQDWKLLD